MRLRGRRVVGAAVVVAMLGSGCAGDDDGDGGGPLVVKAGSGGFAMKPPPDSSSWWASYAFPICVESGEARVKDVALAGPEGPRAASYRVLTYDALGPDDGAEVTRGGFLRGRPTQVLHDGRPHIRWGGDLTAGSVEPLGGAVVDAPCGAKPRDVGQYVVVSLRVGPEGAAADGFRLRYEHDDKTSTTSQSDWEMIACGPELSGPSAEQC